MKTTVIHDLMNIVCPGGQPGIPDPRSGEKPEKTGGFQLLYDETESAEMIEKEKRDKLAKKTAMWK